MKLIRIMACLGMVLSQASAFGQLQAGFSNHSLVAGGDEREYLLYLPEDFSEKSLPLVFNFHGSGSNPQMQVEVSKFDQLAELHGFAVVFPVGAFTNSVTERSWNANVESGVDDVQFVREMIEDVAESVNIDRSRIYTTGFSGGGRISSRLACELSDVLAAAAPVAGLQYPDDCTLQRPIPVLSFHGQADRVNNYELLSDSRPYWRMGVETALDKWRQANGCTLSNSADRLSQQVTFYKWSECDGSAALHFYQIGNGGHTWPGMQLDGDISRLGLVNRDINASEIIWEFFSKHRLP